MLTKNCRIVLEALSSESNTKTRFYVGHISEISGLPFEEARRAAEHLAQMGFLEILPPENKMFEGRLGFERYSLTELGVDYKAVGRAEWREYFKEKWIDFLALIVAIIALGVSIFKN